MAYVRKTEVLIDDISRRVRTMKETALRDFESDTIQIGSPLHDAARETVETAAYQEAPHLKGQLPKAWLKKKERVRLKVFNDDRKILDLVVDSSDTNPFMLPAHCDAGYYAADVSAQYENCHPLLQRWIDAESERAFNRQETEERFRTVEIQLRNFMMQHASLNAALKEMPEIELYIPEKYMAKVREPSAPREKKEQPSRIEELGIDRNQLAAIAITHRMTATN